MNALFAVGLFDNPWILALFVIVSALADWLAKRRQEKQAGQPPERETPAPPAGKPAGEINLEDALRRMMGDQPQTQAPPPIPRATQTETPPVPDWREEDESVQPTRQTIQVGRPPPIPVTHRTVLPAADKEDVDDEEKAAIRFEQLNEQGRHPAMVLGHGLVSRSRAGKRASSQWRHPRNVRQAFVASLVFAQPKSLELGR